MSPQTRRLIILLGVALIAGILAFPLRETIYQMVVVPLALIAWYFKLFYRSFSQGTWWWIIVFLVLLIAASSLMPGPAAPARARARPKPHLGQVEALAVWLGRADEGIYFKWLIANRLGKLAYQILVHRESGRPRSVFAPLVGVDWEPKQEVQSYLETGLHGSFAEFPNSSRLGGPPQNPLDLKVAEAVEFLESQIENGNYRQA
jgi:hypothetical protein